MSMFRGTSALLLACICLSGVPHVHGIFGSLFGGDCSDSERCFLGIGYVVHETENGEDENCSDFQSCVLFPGFRSGITCGTCQLPVINSWLFTTTNSPTENKLLAYIRTEDGGFELDSENPTGGVGGIADEENGDPADPLGSQYSVVTHEDRCVFAVNAGDNTITSWSIAKRVLTRQGPYTSFGLFPVSIATSGDSLYILNAGGEGAIAGYTIGDACELEAIPLSKRVLNAGQTNPPFFVTSPAQIGFTPDGKFLVVTIKGLRAILTYAVDANGGIATEPVTTTSNGLTPFGFDFDSNGNIMVVEAFGTAGADVGDGNAGAVSSYRIEGNGSLTVISGSVSNAQTAACWLISTEGFAITTNNIANTISVFNVDSSTQVTVNNAAAVSFIEGPADFDIAADGTSVYVLSSGNEANDFKPSIVNYRLGDGGSLERINSTEEGLPMGSISPTIMGVVGLALADAV